MISTPRRPPRELYATVTTPATTTVFMGLMFSMTLPILMAASVTEAMMMVLKKTPR